jgi:hypothetical protein
LESATQDDLDLAVVEKRRGNIEVIEARILKTLPKMARDALDHPEDCPSHTSTMPRSRNSR